MEGNGQVPMTLRHLPLGMERARIEVLRPRWACRECGQASTEEVPFRASGQRITLPLLTFVYDLLALGQTLKAVSPTAGLNRNVVKKIDRARPSTRRRMGTKRGSSASRSATWAQTSSSCTIAAAGPP